LALPAQGKLGLIFSEQWRAYPSDKKQSSLQGILAGIISGKIHKTLRVTPAMEAGVTNHVWEMKEVVDLLG
jgi:hypothetical protein